VKLGERVFKKNTVIIINSDTKKNLIYAMDITTKKIYSHAENEKFDINVMATFAMVLAGGITFFSDRYRSQLYLSNVSQSFKILIIFFGILLGILIFLLMQKNQNIFHLEDYFKKFPSYKEIHDSDKIKKILEKANGMSTANFFLIFGGIIGSIAMYNRFLTYSNLLTYIWATLLFGFSAFLTSGIKQFIFILGFELPPTEKSSVTKN